jgi:hypothetical protein
MCDDGCSVNDYYASCAGQNNCVSDAVVVK